MNKKQLFGIIGSVILFFGVFAPIVSVPVLGNLNYFQNGKGDGLIILILSVLSLILVLAKKYKGLWFTGGLIIAVMAFTFVNLQIKISDMKMQMENDLAGNPFHGFASMLIQSVQIQWGWALLIVGAVLLIVSAAMKDEKD